MEALHRNERMPEEWARLTLVKEAGDSVWDPKIEASIPEAALNGLAYLVAEYASLTGQPVFKVLAKLTVLMLGDPEADNPSVACGDSSPARGANDS